VLQEVATVKPGRADRYLDAVASRWRPLAVQRGLTLMGAYRTAMRDTEVITLWCVPDFGTLTDHLATYGRDPAVRRWAEHARTWRVDYRETLLVPSIWCVTHPDWRQQARGKKSAARR
jgi:hypothetical protein